ncbi:TPA: class I SAM-dependent methyltransferase [Legionella pneumophila]|nr:class I SAM-dependent methyltransferase [Legionella pneumophila]HAU0883295.1 class I SAM-dependent methyltransferase [Legionella pneumophila]HCD9576956.1 class I SAM-dependent methyltransferase [Legionella pneumophila]HDO7947844.1 class I SAM-dependent methyltransferase [Legionella pneumophila]HDO7951346.1 class I SAM-dependent methyltransferase [Legionella pneumophila]
MKTGRFDQARADAFAERLLSVLNDAALTLMISIGHRTGLFDVMDELDFASSEVIAEAAGCNERYVREWLNALVVGGIVDYDAHAKAYQLPAEHASFLTRKSSPQNMAVVAQFIPVLAYVENGVVDAFKHGGGVPYEAYHRFHEVMAEESGQTILSSLTDKILPMVHGLLDKLNQGIQVLDIGCGYGRALILMAKTYPQSQFTGYDLCDETIAHAVHSAKENKIQNIHFEKMDLSVWDEQEKYDLITSFDVIHDQAKPAQVLSNVFKALKPRGIFLMQDIKASSDVAGNVHHPLGALIYTISCMHCMTVSLSQNGLGLGAAWGEELAEKMLVEAGFGKIEKHYLEHDIMNTYYVMRK